jgi:hypothetical protein
MFFNVNRICFFTIGLIFFTSCKTDAQRQAEKVATENAIKAAREKLVQSYFTLAVEKNIEFDNIPVHSCSYPSTIKTNVFAIPVNRELIDAAIELKCTQENLSESTKDSLRSRNYTNFLRSNRVAFVLIVVNNKLNSGETVRFDNFRENTKLLLDNDSALTLSNLTPSLEMTLKPGFNSGYIYFSGVVPSVVITKKVNLFEECYRYRSRQRA